MTQSFYGQLGVLLASLPDDVESIFKEEFTNALEQLKEDPMRGTAAVPFSDFRGVRIAPVGDFFLLYRVAGSKIFLLTLDKADLIDEIAPQN